MEETVDDSRSRESISEYADVAKTGIAALVPGKEGWLFGLVLIMAMILAVFGWIFVRSLEQQRLSAERLTTYLIEVEQNRSEALERQQLAHKDEIRRYQETVLHLVQSVARDSERAGMAALSAIEGKADALKDAQ